MLQTTANIPACDKHILIVTNLYKYWQTYTNCDKHKKRQETKKYIGIEALADARRALKNNQIYIYL